MGASIFADNKFGQAVKLWCILNERIPGGIKPIGKMTPKEVMQLYDNNRDMLEMFKKQEKECSNKTTSVHEMP